MHGVVIEDLTVRYGDVVVVRDVSMVASMGAITALIGPNGAGKTTTIEVCVGLRAWQSGQVHVLGANPAHASAGHRSQVGIMTQDGGIPANARPSPWLQSLARLYSDPLPIDGLMTRLGISAAWPTVRRMSGGQLQRLKLASALIGRPKVLFLDEPTAGLDHAAKGSLIGLIRELKDDGTCIVLTTHDLGDVELLADDIVVMTHGSIAASGTLAELTAGEEGIRFQAPPRLSLASLSSVLPDHNEIREHRPGEYIVFGKPTPALLATVTHWCAEQGVVATSIHMGTRNLTDVYEQLLGEASPT